MPLSLKTRKSEADKALLEDGGQMRSSENEQSSSEIHQVSLAIGFA